MTMIYAILFMRNKLDIIKPDKEIIQKIDCGKKKEI